jgi:hypothetical protein
MAVAHTPSPRRARSEGLRLTFILAMTTTISSGRFGGELVTYPRGRVGRRHPVQQSIGLSRGHEPLRPHRNQFEQQQPVQPADRLRSRAGELVAPVDQ